MSSTATLLAPDDVRGTSFDESSVAYEVGLRQLVAFFRAKGAADEEAQDLANETVLRTLIHLRRHGRTSKDLGPLARTIARNLLTERYRRARPLTVPLTDAADVASDEPDPADEALAAEKREAVRTALASLQPRHRRVVEMWMEGSTPADIARELGIKRNAADALLHRARKTLASRLRAGHALGAFGLFRLRVRHGGRRLLEHLPMLDPSGSLAGAATAIAAISLATVITGSAGGHTTGNPAHPSAPVAEQVDAAARADGSEAPVGSAVVDADAGTRPAQSGEPRVHADLTDHRIGAETRSENPTTGEEEDIGFSIRHVRDENDRGISGPLLDSATDSACSVGCPEVSSD